MKINRCLDRLRPMLLMVIGVMAANISHAGIIASVSGGVINGTYCRPVTLEGTTSCSASFSGTPSSYAGLVSDMDASASGTYGALHVTADASLVGTQANSYLYGSVFSGAEATVTTQDTFHPSVTQGVLEYQLLLDGSLTQLTPGCFDCYSQLALTVSTSGQTQSFNQQVLNLSGNLGTISQMVTVYIPYQNTGSFTVSLALTAAAAAGGEMYTKSDWIDAADFGDTLSVVGLGVVGAPGAALNATSGFNYAGLNSVPEPSTFCPLAAVFGVCCFVAAGYRLQADHTPIYQRLGPRHVLREIKTQPERGVPGCDEN